jgi:hypothetical protein
MANRKNTIPLLTSYSEICSDRATLKLVPSKQ